MRTRYAQLLVVVMGCEGALKHGEMLDRRTSSRSDEPEGLSGAGGGNAGAAGGILGGASGAGHGPGTAATGGVVGGGAGSGSAEGGAGAAGEGGESGASGSGGAPPDPTTVRGRIIDFWLAPLAGVPVTIGTATATTDADGRFEIEDVAPTYDVSFVVRVVPNQILEETGWVYEGLTRRDPTLQVYGGRPLHSGVIEISRSLLQMPPLRKISLVAASPNGSKALNDVLRDELPLAEELDWAGPVTTDVTIHALLWETDIVGLPTSYLSYDGRTTTLTKDQGSNVTLDLPNGTVSAGNVEGMIDDEQTMSGSGGHWNVAFLRFPDGGPIELVREEAGLITGAPGYFNYLVPTLRDAAVTVAAFRDDGHRIAYRNFEVGTFNNFLWFSEIPTLLSPEPDSDNIHVGTSFGWQGPTDSPFVFSIVDDAGPPHRGIYVVTSSTQISLPSFGQAFALRPNTRHVWKVEKHGVWSTWSSVDELARPDGFLDAFSWASGPSVREPKGPRRELGIYSVSLERTVFTEP